MTVDPIDRHYGGVPPSFRLLFASASTQYQAGFTTNNSKLTTILIYIFPR